MHTGELPPSVGGTTCSPQLLGCRHQNLARTRLLSSSWCCSVPVLVSQGCPWAALLLPGWNLCFLTFLPHLQYFPGRPCVQTYLQTLDAWLRNWTEPELPRTVLKEAMKNNRDVRCPWVTPSPCSPYPCPFPHSWHCLPAPPLLVCLSTRPPSPPCSPPTSPGWAARAVSATSVATPVGSGPSSTC